MVHQMELDIRDERPDFVAQFRKRRKRQLLVSLPAILAILGAGALGGGSGSIGVPQVLAATALVVVILSMFVFSFLNWRCPSCDAYLGRSMNPRHCSACGARLRD